MDKPQGWSCWEELVVMIDDPGRVKIAKDRECAWCGVPDEKTQSGLQLFEGKWICEGCIRRIYEREEV